MKTIFISLFFICFLVLIVDGRRKELVEFECQKAHPFSLNSTFGFFNSLLTLSGHLNEMSIQDKQFKEFMKCIPSDLNILFNAQLCTGAKSPPNYVKSIDIFINSTPSISQEETILKDGIQRNTSQFQISLDSLSSILHCYTNYTLNTKGVQTDRKNKQLYISLTQRLLGYDFQVFARPKFESENFQMKVKQGNSKNSILINHIPIEILVSGIKQEISLDIEFPIEIEDRFIISIKPIISFDDSNFQLLALGSRKVAELLSLYFKWKVNLQFIVERFFLFYFDFPNSKIRQVSFENEIVSLFVDTEKINPESLKKNENEKENSENKEEAQKENEKEEAQNERELAKMNARKRFQSGNSNNNEDVFA